MKFLKRSQHLFFAAISMVLVSCSSQQGFIPFGQPEIDRIRQEAKLTPTDSENFDERVNTLSLWMRFMMFYGADIHIDQEKHKENIRYFENEFDENRKYVLKASKYTPENAAEIDYRYNMMEEMWADFSTDTNQHIIELERDPSDNNGEVTNWPSIRGNIRHTAATTDSGPMKGEVRWKFPTPHAWFTRPAFDNGRAYVGSPGVSYLAYCIDTETGEYVWKSIPKGNGLRTRYYGPRSSSSVLLSGDNMISRRVQVSGAEEHFIYINKDTGVQQKGIVNKEFLNSSSGYAPFDGNEKYLVYPQGIQPVVQREQVLDMDPAEYRKIREDFPFDNLVCKSIGTGEEVWKQSMGEFYAEPLLSGSQVFVGNMAGDFRCYNLEDGALLWEVKTGAPINAKAAVSDGLVLIGTDSGGVFAFDRNTGVEAWSATLPTEPRAFQLFSRFTIAGDLAYLGSADTHVYCFETKTGQQKWKVATDDWVRSAPLVVGGKVYAATLGGKLFCIESKQGVPVLNWEKTVSEFPILADLTEHQGGIFFTTPDYYLVSVAPDSGAINWKTSTFERITDKDGNIILGDITGQPDEQSSVIAVDGKAYFGMPGFVYCVDIESGKLIWRFEEKGQFSGAPYVSNGKLFIGQRGGTPNFYCLDAATGEMIWKKRLGHVWASAHGLDGRVYLNTEGGGFYCLMEDTGDVVWQYQAGLGLSYNTPGFYKNLVYLGANHDYYAFDQLTGELIWKYNIGGGKTDSGNFLIEDGIFYCGGMFGGQYSAIDALTGEEIWMLPDVGSNTSPTTDGTNLIVDTGGVAFTTYARTVALDLKTGEIQYELPFGGLSGPALGNNLVFMATRVDPFLRAWDAKTGEIRWQFRMGGRGAESCATIYGDKAFFIADDSYAYCFE